MTALSRAESLRQHYRRAAEHAAQRCRVHAIRAYRLRAHAIFAPTETSRRDAAASAQAEASQVAEAERAYRRACRGAVRVGEQMRREQQARDIVGLGLDQAIRSQLTGASA